MSQITHFRCRGKLYTYSFTTGVKPVEPKVRVTDDTILADCKWLEEHGKADEALELLDWYCSQR